MGVVILLFELTMPGVGSWNGKWSGDSDYYAVTRNVPSSAVPRGVIDGRHRYRWDDGWCASVRVSIVSSAEATKARRKSDGFCGYDWMVDSLLSHGKITTEPPC